MVHIITSAAEFNELTADKSKKVIVDFFAEWCGPCKVIAPKYEDLAAANPDIVFVKVDVDALGDVSSQAGIRAMPTFQTYTGGEKKGELLGADFAKLKKLIEDLKAL
ncbi:hypothetical protein FBU30_000010 [Linnemannia zychae]|nr:hypothetical protein FBU30_000010 [Linnemannia zychae]